MRKNQVTQIKAAQNAYIIQLDKKETRFAVYLDGQPIGYSPNASIGLEVLWPGVGDVCDNKTNKILLPYQVYSNSSKLPAYHFYFKTDSHDNPYDCLARMLHDINPDIKTHSLGGCSPWFVRLD